LWLCFELPLAAAAVAIFAQHAQAAMMFVAHSGGCAALVITPRQKNGFANGSGSCRHRHCLSPQQRQHRRQRPVLLVPRGALGENALGEKTTGAARSPWAASSASAPPAPIPTPSYLREPGKKEPWKRPQKSKLPLVFWISSKCFNLTPPKFSKFLKFSEKC